MGLLFVSTIIIIITVYIFGAMFRARRRYISAIFLKGRSYRDVEILRGQTWILLTCY